MSGIYFILGIYHFINPSFYLQVMPGWLPLKLFLIYISGAAEIVLAVMLMIDKTQKLSALLIIIMLVIYLFLIHIPQTIDYYETENVNLLISIIRLPVQVLLITWAGVYVRRSPVN